MSCGLTEDNSWVDPQLAMTETDFLGLVANGLKYSHAPGVVYEHSNIGFTLAAIAVQRVTRTSIEALIPNEILAPLAMTSTSFSPSSYDPAKLASGYTLDANDNWRPYAVQKSVVFAAAAGMVSTVRDISVWANWLGEAFRPVGSSVANVLSRASRREMQRIESVIPPSITLQSNGTWRTGVGGYALGLHVEHDLYRGIVVSHTGGLPGYKLQMCWHPDSGHGLVVLTNSHRGNMVCLTRENLARLLSANNTPSETIVLWEETVAARLAAERLIRNWDDRGAEQLFAENVDFDRPLEERRAEIDVLISQIGPLGKSRAVHDVVSAVTSADVTWSIPGALGELICMVHLNALNPPRVQEFVVVAVTSDMPRGATRFDISPRRAGLGEASLSAGPNVRVVARDIE